MKYYIDAFMNCLDFDGRASRKEFWMFTLFHYIFALVFMFADAFFGWYPETVPIQWGYSYLIYIFLSALPSICIQVRRLHDVGKSGSWWFFRNVPIFGLYVFYLNLKAGDSGPNYYGVPTNSAQNLEPYKSKFTKCPKCGYIAVFEKKCPKCDFVLPTEAKRENDSGTPKILFCRKCGARLLEDARFCNECGTEIITKGEGM